MDIQTVTEFFKWCSIINGAMLIISSIMLMYAADFVYSIHSKWFPISRTTFNTAIYSFIGLFKILFIFFNLIPYVALVILG